MAISPFADKTELNDRIFLRLHSVEINNLLAGALKFFFNLFQEGCAGL
jgi:hypothetical protein